MRSRVRFTCLIIAVAVSLPAAAFAADDLPVEGVVTSGVGWRLDPFGSGKLSYHRGVDIAVPVGTPVRATGKGKVIFAGNRGGYGQTVVVEHDNGDRTLYGHNSAVTVSPGEEVPSGAVVAFSGNSGRSTGPHVHYEVIASGGKKDDVAVAAAMPAAALAPGQWRHLDRKLDQTVDSILKKIKSEISDS